MSDFKWCPRYSCQDQTLAWLCEPLQHSSPTASELQIVLDQCLARHMMLRELNRHISDTISIGDLEDELADSEEYVRKVSFMHTCIFLTAHPEPSEEGSR